MSTQIRFTTPYDSVPRTHAGLTYTQPSSGVYSITGTGTGTSFLRFYYSTTAMPSWLQYDTKYRVDMVRTGTTSIMAFQVWCLRGSASTKIFDTHNGDTEFSVPSSAGYTGMLIRITNSWNTTATINETLDITLTQLFVYVPRLSETSPTNMVGNPYYAGQTGGYYALPNCTRYCYGRWWEIMQTQPLGLSGKGNAEDWWSGVTAYDKGQAPRLGAIICFADGRWSGWGHVAVLEKINSDGTYTFSNSGYPSWYFYKVTGNASNNYGYDSSYRFQGFIYLPEEYIDDVTPDEKPTRFKKPFWFYLKRKPF